MTNKNKGERDVKNGEYNKVKRNERKKRNCRR